MAAAVDLDPNKLRQELQELSKQRFEVNERLRSWDTRGRGRPLAAGWGPGPEPGAPSQQRAEPSGARGGQGLGHPPAIRDQPSFRNQQGGFRDQQGFNGPPQGHSRPHMQPAQVPDVLPPPPSAAAGPAKKLMSTIVVNGQTRMLRQASDEAAEVQRQDDFNVFKRPAPRDAEQNPAAQKRARRMFGALMGTLAKASAEEQQFQAGGASQKRQEAMQRVREREREERARAREVARQKEIAEKQAEVMKKRELSAMTDVKRLEIMTAERLRHHVILANFIRTKAGPPLHWLPAAHNAATEALLAEQQTDLEAWKVTELEKLEAERKSILAARVPHLLQDANGVTADGGAEAADGEEAAEAAGTEDAAADEAGSAGAEAGGARWQAEGAAGSDGDDRWQEADGADDAADEAADDAADDAADANEAAAPTDVDLEADAAMEEDRNDDRAAETLEDLLQ